jgi:hypothetical protein
MLVDGVDLEREGKDLLMRYEDYDQYDYKYDDLLENTEDLDEEPWMQDAEDDDVPSYGKNNYSENEQD